MMKKFKKYIILFFLLLVFILTFKYSTYVKSSVISSMELWFKSLVPSMLPLYLIIDLLINYGLMDLIYLLFKNNSPVLLLISFLSGTPSNAKYIKEFYLEGLIDENTANLLLLCGYSPSPLFILTISPSVSFGLIVLSYIYITNLFIYLLFKPRFKSSSSVKKEFPCLSFIDCLTSSIMKSFNTLILILGVIVFFGLLNTYIKVLNIDSVFLSSILELTNALYKITSSNLSIIWFLFATSFGGLSIHAQIKSILEDTPITYKYFLYGRLIASIPLLLIIIFL